MFLLLNAEIHHALYTRTRNQVNQYTTEMVQLTMTSYMKVWKYQRDNQKPEIE